MGHVLYVNGDRLSGYFISGSLHGFTTENNSKGQPKFIGFYSNGKPSGKCWRITPDFYVALYGQVNEKSGKFTGDKDLFLVHFHKDSDVFGVDGKFVKGILQGKGELKKIKSVKFTDEGLLMHMELGKTVSVKYRMSTIRYHLICTIVL